MLRLLLARHRLFTVGGIPVYLHWSWYLVAYLYINSEHSLYQWFFPSANAFSNWGFAAISTVLFFTSILLHEMGHAIASKIMRIKEGGITLFALGAFVLLQSSPKRWIQEFVLAIAGPVVTFIIAGLLMWFGRYLGHTPLGLMCTNLGQFNLFLGVLNMLPAFPLDGGRVTHAIFWQFAEDEEGTTSADIVIAIIGIVISFIMILGGNYRGGYWASFTFQGFFVLLAALNGFIRVRQGKPLYPTDAELASLFGGKDTIVHESTSTGRNVPRRGRRSIRSMFLFLLLAVILAAGLVFFLLKPYQWLDVIPGYGQISITHASIIGTDANGAPILKVELDTRPLNTSEEFYQLTMDRGYGPVKVGDRLRNTFYYGFAISSDDSSRITYPGGVSVDLQVLRLPGRTASPKIKLTLPPITELKPVTAEAMGATSYPVLVKMYPPEAAAGLNSQSQYDVTFRWDADQLRTLNTTELWWIQSRLEGRGWSAATKWGVDANDNILPDQGNSLIMHYPQSMLTPGKCMKMEFRVTRIANIDGTAIEVQRSELASVYLPSGCVPGEELPVAPTSAPYPAP